jgi:hypothetical protein
MGTFSYVNKINYYIAFRDSTRNFTEKKVKSSPCLIKH